MTDFIDLDKRLQLEPQFETDVKILLGTKLRGKVTSSFFGSVIADSLLSEINWNGRKNMKQISSFKFFQSTLYGCVNRFYLSFDEYEKDIKDAIKKGKNRIDQQNHKPRLQNKMIL